MFSIEIIKYSKRKRLEDQKSRPASSYSKFEASLSYFRYCLKKENLKNKRETGKVIGVGMYNV